jgi:hypothetical protein
MNNESSSEKKIRFDIPLFEYSPDKQEEINNQKEFLKLYYKNNYETVLHYTGYTDENNVMQYYTVRQALRDYDALNNEVLFEQRSGYNLYSILITILKRIFQSEKNQEKKKQLLKNFFTDYEKWKQLLKSKVDIDERYNKQESVLKEFSDLNQDQDEYGYYDTNFEGGIRKHKRKTTRKNRRKSKKSRKSKRKNKNTRKR